MGSWGGSRPKLELTGRSAGCQFAQHREEPGCRFGIVERGQIDGRREIRGIRPEAHFQEILLARSDQGIDDGAHFLGPVSARGQHDRSWPRKLPSRRARTLAVAVSGPAVVHHVQMEGRWAVQIGFEGERFLLVSPEAHEPLDGQRAGTQIQGEAGVFEPARRELKTGLQARTARPTAVDNFTPATAGHLHPAQCGRPFAAVIARKCQVPYSNGNNGTRDVDQEKAPHTSLVTRDGTSD